MISSSEQCFGANRALAPACRRSSDSASEENLSIISFSLEVRGIL